MQDTEQTNAATLPKTVKQTVEFASGTLPNTTTKFTKTNSQTSLLDDETSVNSKITTPEPVLSSPAPSSLDISNIPPPDDFSSGSFMFPPTTSNYIQPQTVAIPGNNSNVTYSFSNPIPFIPINPYAPSPFGATHINIYNTAPPSNKSMSDSDSFQFPPPPNDSLLTLTEQEIKIVEPPPPLEDEFKSVTPPPLPKTAPPPLPKKPPPPIPKKTSKLSSRQNEENILHGVTTKIVQLEVKFSL